MNEFEENLVVEEISEEEKESKLIAIEKDLLGLVKEDSKSWVEIYKLMRDVKTYSLFSKGFKNFTAWVNDFAKRADVHPSTLWNRFDEGQFYTDYQQKAAEKGIEVPAIEDVKVSPDNFVFVKKIAGDNDDVAFDLMEKVLKRDLTRKDLKNAWAVTKADLEENGEPTRRKKRKKDEALETIDKPEEEQVPEEEEASEEKELVVKKRLQKADIMFALSKANTWLPKRTTENTEGFRKNKSKTYASFNLNAGPKESVVSIDALSIDFESTERPDEVNLHGIEVVVDPEDINIDELSKFEEYVDYLWLIVPDDILSDVIEKKADSWGIMKVNDNGVSIAASAEKLSPALREVTLSSALYKAL